MARGRRRLCVLHPHHLGFHELSVKRELGQKTKIRFHHLKAVLV
jgi:hypothetical protein